jgi:hypothetical protein
MYILYVDDSGSIPNPNEEYFVLGGVCVPERSISWLTRQLDDFAETLDSTNPNQIDFMPLKYLEAGSLHGINIKAKVNVLIL